MSRASRSRGSLILVSAAALFLPFLFAPVHASADVRVSLETESAPPGGSFLVAARGFGPYEAIDLFLDERDVPLVVADERGNADDVLVEVPAGTAPGDHWLTLVGRRTGRVVQETVSVDTDWAQLGFDAARAGVNPFEHRLRPSVADELRVAWERDLAAKGWSDDPARTFASPAVVDGVVYIAPSGAFVDRGPRGVAYAFDAWTGRMVWSAPDVGVVMASPAVVGNLVLLNAGYPFRVVALHADTGRVVWTRATMPEGLGLEGENWQAISPVVVGDTVYVSVHANVGGPHRVRPFERTYALDLGTGAVRWSREITGHLAVSGAVVYVGGEELSALSAVTGETLWTRSIGPDAWIGAPAVASGTVYAGGARGGGVARLYAFETSGGAIRWSVELPTAVAARPAVAGGTVFALSVRGVVSAVSASAGTRRWSVRVWEPGSRDEYLCSEGVCPGPSVANGVVYLGSLGRGRYQYPGTVLALDAATGRVLLERNVSRQVMSTPAVVDGMVFVTSLDGTLYALGASGLAPVDVPRPEVASLAIDHRRLPDETHEVEPATRSWMRVVTGGFGRGTAMSSSVVFDDALYVGTRTDVRAGAGAEVWRSSDGVRFERVVTDGLGDRDNRSIELAVHDGRLWATTTNRYGFEVWSSQDGTTFRPVASADRPSSEHATPVAFGDHVLLLVDDERYGAEILVLDPSAEAEPFRTVVEGGLGDVGTTGFAASPSSPGRHGVVFGDALYVGTTSASGGRIWRTTDGIEWEVVASEGLRDRGNVALAPQLVFRGRLYVVSRNGRGLEVYRTDDGETWERVVTDGLGAGPQRNVMGSLAAFEDPARMILVTRNVPQLGVMPDGMPLEVGVTGGLQVYRSAYGGRWTKVTRDGFGDPHAYAGVVAQEGGVAYVAAENYREGDAVWRSVDGRSWELLFREPRATPMSSAVSMAVFERHLVLMHGDEARGLSVWRYLPEIPVTPEALPPAVPTASPAPAAEATGDEFVTWVVVAAAVLIGFGIVALAIRLIRRGPRPTGRATGGRGLHLRHGHT